MGVYSEVVFFVFGVVFVQVRKVVEDVCLQVCYGIELFGNVWIMMNQYLYVVGYFRCFF